MTSVARQHNYSKIMVGDCSTRLAARLLSDIAQGRGAQVSMETVIYVDVFHSIYLDSLCIW